MFRDGGGPKDASRDGCDYSDHGKPQYSLIFLKGRPEITFEGRSYEEKIFGHTISIRGMVKKELSGLPTEKESHSSQNTDDQDWRRARGLLTRPSCRTTFRNQSGIHLKHLPGNNLKC